MQIQFAAAVAPKRGALFVAAYAERVLSPAAAALDRATDGALSRAVEASPKFTGALDQTLAVPALAGGGPVMVVLTGLGNAADVDVAALQRVGGTVVAEANRIGCVEAVARIDGFDAAKGGAADIAFGATLRAWRFDRYRTKEKAEAKPTLSTLTVQTDDADRARTIFADRQALAEGVFLTRDLVSEPPNVLYPAEFANRLEALRDLGVEVEVLGDPELEKLGMGALLGVGQGSVHQSRVVVMQWKGAADRTAQPIAIVGKGVTFDTGGISLKPGAGMEDMKWDMAGAGVVAGLMKALAGRKAKANVVGVVALVENMPSGAAQRPGDIVTSMSGQTIEVHNTDAEGRLILADALWYTQDRFKPKFIVDLATLTGAIIVALGSENAGLYANDDALAENLLAAGRATGETLWRMPLGSAYDKMIDSDVADMKNIAGTRDAGSIVGAVFLQRFVNGVPWAHLDIAGVAWSKKDTPIVPKGATAFGVRLLDRLVSEQSEG
jgi:leucyl aminopeptidase